MTEQEILLTFCSTDRRKDYVNAYFANDMNITAAANALGVDRRAVGRGLEAVREEAFEAGFQLLSEEPRVGFFDIETTPISGYVWHPYQKNGLIGGHKHVITDCELLSFAWKWKGVDKVEFFGRNEYSMEDLLQLLWERLDESDWVIAHNGDNFDFKLVNAWMTQFGMKPYRNVKQIDTLKMAKRRFKFTVNRLDYLCQALLGEGKTDTGGFDLWLQCMEGDPEAWALMREYNEQDVALLEKLYYRLAAWDKSHPNYALWSGAEAGTMCGTCGSSNISRNGIARTAASKFQNYTCNDCGAHWRGRKSTHTTPLAAAR